jgi:hypothetical protein
MSYIVLAVLSVALIRLAIVCAVGCRLTRPNWYVWGSEPRPFRRSRAESFGIRFQQLRRPKPPTETCHSHVREPVPEEGRWPSAVLGLRRPGYIAAAACEPRDTVAAALRVLPSWVVSASFRRGRSAARPSRSSRHRDP